jgi:gamma-glutamylputrescine oxidase
MPDAAWGAPPWDSDPGLPPAEAPAHADVVVVGAGLTGLSAAWHLARRGVRTAVVEAGRVGDGASGRTGAIVLEGTAAGPLPGVDACLATLARVVAEADVACGLRLDGCWEVAHEAPGAPGHALWPDGDAMLHVVDCVAGGTVDAGALLRGLARGAHAAGATIVERTPAETVEDGVVAVPGGRIAAGCVVVALNAYTATLVPLAETLGTALTLAVATAPLDEATLAAIGLAERVPFYTVDLPYLWGRTLDDGTLVVGAGLLFPAGPDLATVRLDAADGRAALARLEQRLRGFHPALAEVPVVRRWGGPIAFVRGRGPLLGPLPGAPRVLVAGGYSGHGVALAVRAGELLADAVVDGTPLPAWGALGVRG